MNNNQNKVMDQRETCEDESQDWAFMRNAVEAAIKAGASTAIPAAALSAIDGATVRPIDQK